jgi:hypothetical protein
LAKKPPPKPVRKAPSAPPPVAKKPSVGGKDGAKIWNTRLVTANKDYDEWAKDYQVDQLAKYYLGKQWRGYGESEAQRKYTINLIFATVETQLPSLMFSRPKVTVEPRPSHEIQNAGSEVANRASLIQSTLQTFVDDPKLHFKFQTTLALRDAYPRYGLIEVGYSADWIDNPNAGKPLLNERDEEMKDETGEAIRRPAKQIRPGSEAPFVRRLQPQSFRAYPGRNVLEENDWTAYAEWFHVDDVKANRDYQNTAELKPTGTIRNESDDAESEAERKKHAGMVRIWKIWDLRKKVRHVIAEGHPDFLQQDRPFKTFPISAMKFYEIADSWYPLPPMFNWMSPQDEINETRDMQRVHRRRAVRRYMREPSVTQAEFEKLEQGDDMTCIEVPKVNPSPIMPIPDAPLDQAIQTELATEREDFMEITGVSGEARGIPQSDTATQANIINVRAQLRESAARVQVADWLGDIARRMLLILREKMRLKFMVKRSVDPFRPSAQSVKDAAMGWQEIEREDIDDLDVDIKIDITSLSPVAEDQQRAQWNVVLQLLTNQAVAILLFTPNPEAPDEPSPLLRKTLWLNGIKSDQEVQEIWTIGQLVLKQAAQAQAAQNKPDPPKISLALKGEDLSNPLVLAMFVQAEGLMQLYQQLKAQGQDPTGGEAPPVPAVAPGASRIQPLAKPAPGPISGTPTSGPTATGA